MTKQPSYLVRRARYFLMIVLWPVAFALIVAEFGWEALKRFGRDVRENTRILNDAVFQVREFGHATLDDERVFDLRRIKPIQMPTPEGYVEPNFDDWN